MDPHIGDGNWRSIAQQASGEEDPAKLMLVAKLCRALDGVRAKKSPTGATTTGNEIRPSCGDQP